MITPFEVLIEFQHAGINFERGNTHRKHNIDAAQVEVFRKIGWVSVGGISDQMVAGDVLIQPDDIQIHTINT